MNDLKYPLLFSPIRLGRTIFKNRIFASPISERCLDSKNRITAEGIAFYEQKAIGGAASVCIGDCMVDSRRGLYGENMICLDDPGTYRSLNRLTDAVSRHGAVMSVELQHCGTHARGVIARGDPVYGPCDGVAADGHEFHAMSEELIEETIEMYYKAAAYAKQCGFGMITVHGGHGWLLSQFMSSKVNHRTDKWGGSLENRMRFPLAVLEAVRRAVGPGFPIEIRISGSEVTPGGYDLDEGIAISKMLDGHVDLLHVSAGHHERPEVFTVTHPSIFCEDSCNVKYAEAIKKVVSVPVATVGAHCDPELMEDILRSGKADVIEIARALMADPDLPNKLRRGLDQEVRPCLRCLACFSHLLTNDQIYCAVNPLIGREYERMNEKPAAVHKKVLVAGGGIAGMHAAIEAARSGHQVVLCEKSDRLGGVLKCEETVPFKKKIAAYLKYQAEHVTAAGVDVRLNTPATPELCDELRPDAIIAALGARPVKPGIEGIDGENVMSAEDAYDRLGEIGQRVVILGGGLVGMELGIHLAMLGRRVDIAEMLPFLNNGGNILHQFALDVELRKYEIGVHLETKALRISPEGVTCEAAGEERFFPADTVIYAVGQAPLANEAYALQSCAPEFYAVGDCRLPKNIMQATAMADAAVTDLGRF